jgi:hypothetical protein
MIEDDFFAIVDPVLREAGSVPEEGEEYRTPPLDVLRYYRRPLRLHWVPGLGGASSVVAVVRQPVDVGLATDGYRRLLTRLAMAVNGRFPPWRWPSRRLERRSSGGLVVGLTAIVLTPEPIGPGDDAALASLLGAPGRSRVVPFGVIRLNLGQEAIAYALAGSPDQLFTEPVRLADALTERFRRFVPLLEME